MRFSSLSLLLAAVVGCSSAESGPGDEGGAGLAGSSGSAGSGAGGLASAGADTGGAEAGGAAGSPAAGATTGGAAGLGGSSGAAGAQGGSAGTAGSAPMAEPGLRWIGRAEVGKDGARIAWPGTGFTARFRGTGAHVSLKTNADFFQLVVDGKASVLSTQAGTKVYDLAKGLPEGEHTVTLWRRTETNNGVVQVGAVTIDGELLAPPAAPSKRLEIIGDSISVGFGVECKTKEEGFTFATENNYLSYQALTARKLGAELYTEAWSGIGMWRDVGGSTTAKDQMPARFLRTIGNEEANGWDFGKYVPDAVVAHLGTNDFAKGDPGQPFVDAYIAFVKDLRTRYPKARQYFALSPMLGGGNRTQCKTYLNNVLTARKAAGDMNVALIEFAQPAADAWGCGHPNGATHAIMAGVLEQALKTDLGW